VKPNHIWHRSEEILCAEKAETFFSAPDCARAGTVAGRARSLRAGEDAAVERNRQPVTGRRELAASQRRSAGLAGSLIKRLTVPAGDTPAAP